MIDNALIQKMNFIAEVDKLKSIYRQTILIDKSRQEDDAGHSWHLALMAVLLCDYSAISIDVLRVVKMVLIHDIVEIDAGDTFLYDDKARLDKAEREELAAKRLFGMLPTEQASELISLWREFEEQQTHEAQFAAALDRLQPMLLNFHTEGAGWKKHKVSASKVIERNSHIEAGSPALWEYAKQLLSEAVEKGYLSSGDRL